MQDLDKIRVGTRVTAKREITSTTPKGSSGVCYEIYDRGDGSTGFSFIFESGFYDGFSPEEIELCLVIHDDRAPQWEDYDFKNVIELTRDFRKLRVEHSPPPCSEGHAERCARADHTNCRCACGGVNHGNQTNIFNFLSFV